MPTRCRSAFLNGVMEVMDAERKWVGADAALLAEWQAGRRDWQRFFGRMLPRYMINVVRAARPAAFAQAFRSLVVHGPGTFEGLVGLGPQRLETNPLVQTGPVTATGTEKGIHPRSAG